MARVKPTVLVIYVCPCGQTQAIQRQRGRRRAIGHLKNLWCVRCQVQTNHLQQEEDKMDG